MLTVMEMLAHPTFKNFRLISDRSGLNNPIRNAAILDWETGKAVDDSFFPGDFVVTSLAAFKDDPELANSTLASLIEKNITGLAINDICFSDVSDNILALANACHIPVFMFSGTNMTEIIYALKNEMTFTEINKNAMKTMRKIIYQTNKREEIDNLAREINPFFSNNIICAFAMPVDFDNKETILNKLASGYRDYLNTIKIDPEVSYSFLFLLIGVCIIYTDQRPGRELKNDLYDLIGQFPISTEDFAVGFSDQMNMLADTDMAAKQAIYAATDAKINHESFKDYRDIGFTRELCPLRSDYWMKNYYENLLDTINNYDEKHDSHLFETIKDYIHCNGDINAAAEASFQHPNTIRYRIKKAQELLQPESIMDFRLQMYTIVRLHEINFLLTDWRL